MLRPDLEILTIPFEISGGMLRYVLANDAKINNRIKSGKEAIPAFLP